MKISKRAAHCFALVFSMLLAWYCVFGYKYSFVYVWGDSMKPSFHHRESVIVQYNLKKDWAPARLDAVVIEDKEENEVLIKRVIGLAGDKIEIKKGYVYVNGKRFDEPYGKGRVSVLLVDIDGEPLRYWEAGEWGSVGDPVVEYTDKKEITVPKGHVWLIGDNRPESWFGVLSVKSVKAIVIF